MSNNLGTKEQGMDIGSRIIETTSQRTYSESLIFSYPKVSFILLNWNGLQDTIECLESIKEITYPNYEVLVVDNGSEGNDVEVLRKKFGDYIQIIENDENYGFSEGNNIGIRFILKNSNPEYILLLNNDTVVDKEFLKELVTLAEEEQKIGIVGPKIFYYNFNDRKDIINFAGADLNLWNLKERRYGCCEVDKGQLDEYREVEKVEGSCMLLKRSLIENIGLLDPDYFTYWEETDYCFRARRAGFRLFYAPKAHVWHKIAASTGGPKSAHHLYYMTRNQFLFLKKNANKIQIFIFLLYFFGFRFWVLFGMHLIYYEDNIRCKFFLKGVLDGLRFLVYR